MWWSVNAHSNGNGTNLPIPTLKVTCTSLMLLVPKQKLVQDNLINQTNLKKNLFNVLFILTTSPQHRNKRH